MALDIELYRRTVYVPARRGTQSLRRISVIDIHPEGATQTLLFVHGFGGNVMPQAAPECLATSGC